MRLTALCLCGTLLAFSCLSWTTADSAERALLWTKGSGPCAVTLRPVGPCGRGQDGDTCPYQVNLPPLTIHLPKELRELENIVNELQMLKDNVDELRKMCTDCTVSQNERASGRLGESEHEKRTERGWMKEREHDRDLTKEFGTDRFQEERRIMEEEEGDANQKKRISEERERNKWETEREKGKPLKEDGKTQRETEDTVRQTKVPAGGGKEIIVGTVREKVVDKKDGRKETEIMKEDSGGLSGESESELTTDVKNKEKTEMEANGHHLWQDKNEKGREMEETQSEEDWGSDIIMMPEDHGHTTKEKEQHREEMESNMERSKEKPKHTESIGWSEKEKTIKNGEREVERETEKEIKSEKLKPVQSVQQDTDAALASSKASERTDVVWGSLAPGSDSAAFDETITVPSPLPSMSSSHLITGSNSGTSQRSSAQLSSSAFISSTRPNAGLNTVTSLTQDRQRINTVSQGTTTTSASGLITQSPGLSETTASSTAHQHPNPTSKRWSTTSKMTVNARIMTQRLSEQTASPDPENAFRTTSGPAISTAATSPLVGPAQKISHPKAGISSTTSLRPVASSRGRVGSTSNLTTTTTNPIQKLHTTTVLSGTNHSLWTTTKNTSSKTKPNIKPLPGRGPKPGQKHKPGMKPLTGQELKSDYDLKPDRAPLPDQRVKPGQKPKPSQQKPAADLKPKLVKKVNPGQVPTPDQRPRPDHLPNQNSKYDQIPNYDQDHPTDQKHISTPKPKSHQKYMPPTTRQKPLTTNKTKSDQNPLTDLEPESDNNPIFNQKSRPEQKPVRPLDTLKPDLKLAPEKPGGRKWPENGKKTKSGQEPSPNPNPDQEPKMDQTTRPDQMPQLNPESIPDQNSAPESDKKNNTKPPPRHWPPRRPRPHPGAKPPLKPGPAVKPKPSPNIKTHFDSPPVTLDSIQNSQTDVPTSSPVKKMSDLNLSHGDTEFRTNAIKTITMGPKIHPPSLGSTAPNLAASPVANSNASLQTKIILSVQETAPSQTTKPDEMPIVSYGSVRDTTPKTISTLNTSLKPDQNSDQDPLPNNQSKSVKDSTPGQKPKPDHTPIPPYQKPKTDQKLKTTRPDQMPQLNHKSTPDQNPAAESDEKSNLKLPHRHWPSRRPRPQPGATPPLKPRPAVKPKPSLNTKTHSDSPPVTLDSIQNYQIDAPTSSPVKKMSGLNISQGDTQFRTNAMKTITLGPKMSTRPGLLPYLHTLPRGITTHPDSRITSDPSPQTTSQPASTPRTTRPNINTGDALHPSPESTTPDLAASPVANSNSSLQTKIILSQQEKAPSQPDKMTNVSYGPIRDTTPQTISLKPSLSSDFTSTTPVTSRPRPPPPSPFPDSTTPSARELRVKINQVAAFLNNSLGNKPPDRHLKSNQKTPEGSQGDRQLSTVISSKVATAKRDCSDHRTRGEKTSGVYLVTPDLRNRTFPVLCDMELQGGGWTVLQRRQDGRVAFNRTWTEYRSGFGELDGGEFWLGNEQIHLLTRARDMVLRVELEDFEGMTGYAEYEQFKVASERLRYRLTVGGYSGSAGDALRFSPSYDHHNRAFTTPDRDHDRYPSGNCGAYYSSGWWFDACMAANLNGKYYVGKYKGVRDGIFWGTWHNIATEHYPTSDRQSFKTVRMMIRPKDFVP